MQHLVRELASLVFFPYSMQHLQQHQCVLAYSKHSTLSETLLTTKSCVLRYNLDLLLGETLTYAMMLQTLVCFMGIYIYTHNIMYPYAEQCKG